MYEQFRFGDVKFLGACNGRLILMISYKVGDDEVEEEMIIFPDGKYHFRYQKSKLYRYWFNEKISDSDYKFYSEHILKQADNWCEDLGFPKLTEEI